MPRMDSIDWMEGLMGSGDSRMTGQTDGSVRGGMSSLH